MKKYPEGWKPICKTGGGTGCIKGDGGTATINGDGGTAI